MTGTHDARCERSATKASRCRCRDCGGNLHGVEHTRDTMTAPVARPMPPTTYVRTRQGARVHRRTCRWLAAGGVTDPTKIVGWRWAEGMTPAEIRAELRGANLLDQVRFCKTCFTGEELDS